MSEDKQSIRWQIEQLKRQGWEAYERTFSCGYAELERSQQHFSDAECLARQAGEASLLVGVLSGLGAVARASGRQEEVRRALGYYWEEVDILKGLGMQLEAADLHAELEAAYRDLAILDPAGALGYLREGLEAGMKALEIIKRHGNQAVMARVGNAVADLCQVLSEHDPDYGEFHLQMAADLYRQGMETWQEQEEGQAVAKMGLAEVYIRMGKNLESARMLLEDALEIYATNTGGKIDYQVAQIHTLIGQLLARQGEMEEAKEQVRKAISIFRRLGVDFTPGRGESER